MVSQEDAREYFGIAEEDGEEEGDEGQEGTVEEEADDQKRHDDWSGRPADTGRSVKRSSTSTRSSASAGCIGVGTRSSTRDDDRASINASRREAHERYGTAVETARGRTSAQRD